MTIAYDRERRVYLDSETGEYMKEDYIDREYERYNFMLYDHKDSAIVGLEAQEYVSKFNEDAPLAERLLQTIILKAWTPDRPGRSPTNRHLLDAGDPLIDRISVFLRARNAHFSRPASPVKYEIVFDPKGEKSVKELKHRD